MFIFVFGRHCQSPFRYWIQYTNVADTDRETERQTDRQTGTGRQQRAKTALTCCAVIIIKYSDTV